MLQPKKTKYKKSQKGKIKGYATRGYLLKYGTFGLKTLESNLITARQIESARIAATRYMKRDGKLWINIFPYKPMTLKPQEVRMGKGKGMVEFWVAPVKPGIILFEVGEISLYTAKEALRLASYKLPVKTKFIISKDFLYNECD
jgi:large subunit ribosomal protein L16